MEQKLYITWADYLLSIGKITIKQHEDLMAEISQIE